MTEEIECGYCWREENLTKAQQLDPANAITGTIQMCDRHEKAWELFHASLKKFEQQIVRDLFPNDASPWYGSSHDEDGSQGEPPEVLNR